MSSFKDAFTRSLARVERFFDRLKLGYKWRFDRWKHLQVVPFWGHGTRTKLHLRGRALDDKNVPPPEEGQPVWKNAWHTLRRIETDEVPGARVQIQFQEQMIEAETDEDGFFEVTIRPDHPLPAERVWHEVTIDLLAPAPDDPEEVRATGRIEVPPADAEFGVISDMDDTVIRTGATNKLQMMRVVLLNNAQSRSPFEGVGAFYEALRRGPDDRGHNPIFYLSSSPWNLYELFQHFFEAHGIPAGPIFLKDYGLEEGKLLSSSHHEHKLSHIEALLETYPELPFVLIGDSGQHDPEIYREIVREHSEQIRAIFIRDVTSPARDAEVHAIADEVEALGTPMVLAETSAEAAEHAADLDLIRPEHVDAVRDARSREEREKEPQRWWQRVFGT